MIDGWGISCEIALLWMSLDFTDDQSTLVQVMAWAVRQQAITWANVDPDLCCHMASLGPSELSWDRASECHRYYCVFNGPKWNKLQPSQKYKVPTFWETPEDCFTEIPKISILDINLEMTNLRLQSNLPRAIGLICSVLILSDICRVCRSEGASDKPLFYPCVCTGSIKYVHQEW